MTDASQIASYARLLKLRPLEGQVEPLGKAAIESPIPVRHGRPGAFVVLSFVFIVVLPVTLAAVYFWLLAADRYVSEARFILRVPGRNMALVDVSNMLQTAGVSRANDDGYIVQQFLESRDAVAWLVKTANLKDALAAAPNDILWRFPNWFTSDSEEGLYKHYQRILTATFDGTTGLSTLRIQAFSAGEAQKLATSLLEAAEALVNRLNDRSRRDAMAVAQAEADRMTARAIASQNAVTAFREREQLVDPTQITMSVLDTLTRLSLEASQVSIQLSELHSSSPRSPQIQSLEGRRRAIESQIALERSRLAGDARSIAPRIAEYERLMLERDFAQRALIAAMTVVELARADSSRHQVYLERVASPSAPDYPEYPWRVVWLLVVAAASYMAFRMWLIVSAEARRHNEL